MPHGITCHPAEVTFTCTQFGTRCGAIIPNINIKNGADYLYLFIFIYLPSVPLKLRPYGAIQICLLLLFIIIVPSVLRRCWLGGRRGIRTVKTEWCGAGMVVCLERDADLHMSQLMPLPLTVCCFSKIQTGFTFLVPAHSGSPGKRAVKRVCVLFIFIYRPIYIFVQPLSQ